jgi:DNA topoisomerase-3
MQLVIAEKPSVAREIAQLFGGQNATRKGNGFIESKDYIVTWALGHLVNIAEPEDQDPQWSGAWKLEQLPMIPQKFNLTVLKSSSDQFAIVERLLGRDDIEGIINATDAGREGELIFRRIYLKAGCKKPVKRLWANDMTEKGLRKAFDNLVDGTEKRNLGLAAFARAEADWLIGMNFSRLFTLKAGNLITVGRVQTPVLKLIADRFKEIANFKVENYYSLIAKVIAPPDDDVSDTETINIFESQWQNPPEFNDFKINELKQVKELKARCEGKQALVDDVIKKKGKQKPPLPYDLTTLQRDANTRFGYSAKDTLELAQSLYEKRKALTYPRTDSSHLTAEIYAEIKNHMTAAGKHFPKLAAEAIERVNKSKTGFACINNNKVTDHHAIIPTEQPISKESLTKNEWAIYEMVSRRFFAAFLPEVEFSSSTIWLSIDSERFKSSGKIYEKKGWLIAEPWRTAEDNPLPSVKKGNILDVSSLEQKKHKTKPPSHFTDATLLRAMETAGKLIEDDELSDAMKERGLGTPATRAQIIETLLSREYVSKDGKKLIATERGIMAIETIDNELPRITSPEMTGRWEKKLKDMEAGKFTYPEFMKSIRSLVSDNVAKLRDSRLKHCALPHAEVEEKDSIGKCPLCKGTIIESEKTFSCANWKSSHGSCRFAIWKNMFGISVSRELACELLANGRTKEELELVSKAGKPYSARLVVKGSKIALSFS